MKKNKLFALTALVCGGATIFQGCLGGFWEGLFGRGWPTNNLWLNIGIDILNEELFG